MDKERLLECLNKTKQFLDKEFAERNITPQTYEMGLWTGKSMMIERIIHLVEGGYFDNE